MEQSLVTTQTITQERVIDDMTINFLLSAVYTYLLGINISSLN
jgi:hypothetical protein